MRIQSLILEFKGLRLVFTSDRVGHSLLWDRGQYGGTFHNSFGKRHFSGKKGAVAKKNTTFVFSAVNIIFIPCFIPFTG